jgi:hypothetical protein
MQRIPDQTKTRALAICGGALFALAAGAQAQVIDQTQPPLPDSNTIIIVTPAEGNAPGSTAVFTPIADDSQPATRADVKAGARDAVQNGGIARGELGPADDTAHGQLPAEPYDTRNANRP